METRELSFYCRPAQFGELIKLGFTISQCSMVHFLRSLFVRLFGGLLVIKKENLARDVFVRGGQRMNLF